MRDWFESKAHYNPELDVTVYYDESLGEWMVYNQDDPQYRESLRHKEYVVQQEQDHKRKIQEECHENKSKLSESVRIQREISQRVNGWMLGLLDCGIEPDSDEYKIAHVRAISRFMRELLPKEIYCPACCEAPICADCRRCYNCEYGIYYEDKHDGGNADAPCSTCNLRDLLNAKYERAKQSVFLNYDLAIQHNPNNALAHYKRGKVKYKLGQTREAELDLRIALILSSEAGNVQLKNGIKKYLFTKAKELCSSVYETLKTCDTKLKSKKEYLNVAEQRWGQPYAEWDGVMWYQFAKSLFSFAWNLKYESEYGLPVNYTFEGELTTLMLPPIELGKDDSFFTVRVDHIIWSKGTFSKKSNSHIAADAGISERVLNQWISEGKILQQQFLSGEIKHVEDLDFYSQEKLRLYEALHPSTEIDF